RAYGGAAAECLRLAPRQPLVETATVAVHVPFAEIALLHHLIAQLSALKLGAEVDAQGARVVLELPADAVADLKSRLRDATRDRPRFGGEGRWRSPPTDALAPPASRLATTARPAPRPRSGRCARCGLSSGGTRHCSWPGCWRWPDPRPPPSPCRWRCARSSTAASAPAATSTRPSPWCCWWRSRWRWPA